MYALSRSYSVNLTEYHADGGVMAPKNRYHFYTPEELHQCFRGKRIVFQGDSIVRQMVGTQCPACYATVH